jgi:prepilin signal peptidase PulO-like enzyme (type II secretory pathway)
MMIVFIFIIGLIFGSFASVLISRLSSHKFDQRQFKWVMIWRSHCPKCKKILWIKNLIPLFSFILQKWKCSYCSQKISTFYPIIELLSWLVFLLTYLIFPYTNYFVLWFWLIINRVLLLIIIYDFTKYELHLPILAIWVSVSLLPQFFGIIWDYQIAFWSSIVLFWTFWLIYFLSKLYIRYRYKKDFEWIWFGDVILSFFLWTLFPFIFQFNNLTFDAFNLIQIILVFIFISAIVWIFIRSIKIFISHHNALSKIISNKLNILESNVIPFLPAMIISYWIMLFYSDFILNLLFR